MGSLTSMPGNFAGLGSADLASSQLYKALPPCQHKTLARLLQISQAEDQTSTQRHSPRLDASISEELLAVCASTAGVMRALAMHILHRWLGAATSRAALCIQQGSVPLMIDVLAASLLTQPSDPSTREAASLAVMSVKVLAQNAPLETSEAFLECNAVEKVLSLASKLEDPRALSLTLYMLNDVTRRCAPVLTRALECGAVPLIVEFLTRPVNEATEFAALLLNRWALAPGAIHVMLEAGAQQALFDVLLRRKAVGSAVTQPEIEASAYSLSAVAILAQHSLDSTRELLLNDSSLLDAVSAAVADYERCFRGVGFPHALLCSLLAGTEGAKVVAAVAAAGLVPTWIAARSVGSKLIERASKPDAQAAMSALPQELQVEVAVALTHMVPHSPALARCLSQMNRVESLTESALCEMMAPCCTVNGSSGSLQASVADDVAQDMMQAIDVAPMVVLDAVPCTSSGPNTPSASGRVPSVILPSSSSGEISINLGDALKETQAAADVTTQLPSPGFPQLVTPTSAARQRVQQTTTAAVPAQQCSAALASLLKWAAGKDTKDTEDKDAEDEQDTATRSSSKRRRPNAIKFNKSDIDVARYDALQFIVGGREVRAVGFVLETRSLFLRNLLSTLTDVKEKVHVPNVAGLSDERMHALFLLAVEWCYTGEVLNLSIGDALELWALAEFLQINGLQRCCEGVLEKGFAGDWQLVEQCYNVALKFASGKPLRLAAARRVLECFNQEEGAHVICEDAKKVLGKLDRPTLAGDLAEAVLERL